MRYDFSRHGGMAAPVYVRLNVPNDLEILREVGAAYGKLPVRGRCVLDIGGHIGAYAILAAQKGASFITSVEPHPDNYRLLCMNTPQESRHRNIHGAAVSDPDMETVQLFAKKCPSMNSLLVRGGTAIDVPAINFHELAAKHQAIKIDCEGAEYDLLLNGPPLPDCVRSVAVELHLGRKLWRHKQAIDVCKIMSEWKCIKRPRIGKRNWVTMGIWIR